MLTLLERLFALAPAPLDVLLSQSSDYIAEVIACEKVDAFLCDARTQTLVAVGSSRTELAQLQRNLGLDRLPLANKDPMALVFETGELYCSGHVERDTRQPRGVVEQMGVRSMLAVPITVADVRRGVLSLASQRPNAFSDHDVSLIKLVGVWVGTVVHRAELMDAMTERASEQLRRSTAEELVTVLAHDLRNLLYPIHARLVLLGERAREAQRDQDVHDCQRSLVGLERVEALMADLLDVARIEQGMLALNRQTFDVVQLARECATALAQPEIEVSVASYSESVSLFADRGRLAQALENVLSNAIKHSPRGGTVHVQLDSHVIDDRPAVRISVIDRGPGIAPELLPRIFDRFVRAGRSAGLGLGLYLARATVAAHGGKIHMTSAPEQGTRCELVLPLSPADMS